MSLKPESGMPARPEPSRSRRVLRWMAIAVVLVAGVLTLRLINQSGWVERALAWLNELGVWAPLAFMAIYVGAALVFIPASLLTLGGGIVFGFVMGSVCVCSAAVISALVSFLISRHLGRAWLTRRFHNDPRFLALDEAVAQHGWKIVIAVRVAPGFPFSITNFGFGLTRIPFWQYFLASLAMIPPTMFYVYLGTLIGDISGIRQGPPLPPWLKWCIAALAIAALTYVARFARRALRSAAPGQRRP